MDVTNKSTPQRFPESTQLWFSQSLEQNRLSRLSFFNRGGKASGRIVHDLPTLIKNDYSRDISTTRTLLRIGHDVVLPKAIIKK